MADDVMVTSADPRTALEERLRDDRQRFVAFAFAGADLLLEATIDGRITFAAGAFRSRFGCEPESFVGQPLSAVVAAEDRPLLATSLALIAARGRISPLALRLSDKAGTPQIISGLCRSGAQGKKLLCLSFGPVPQPPQLAAPGVCSAATLVREAEARLRTASAEAGADVPELGLLEVVAAKRTNARGAEVATVLLEHAGAGILAAELSPGRFGLLHASDSATDGALADVVVSAQAALLRRGITAMVASGRRIPLAGEATQGISQAQAVRALRYALSSFSRGGPTALHQAGFANGLAGFLSAASERTLALRRVFAERRFGLAFQPVVSLDERCAKHYEALLRPEKVPGGPAGESPGEMVTLAEMVGLTDELDWAVFNAASEAASASGAGIAFNLSGLSVQNPEFRSRLLEGVTRFQSRSGGDLLAEITETAEIEDTAAAAETIHSLREHGVRVCIDDFGAGAAAFQYLRHFQVDYVKVDGSYVRNAAENERDRGFVAAMVDLSLTVGAKAIAEQIETEEVAEIMRGLGVEYGQGWLFGRPGELPKGVPVAQPRRVKGVAWQEWVRRA
ncbi:MAG: EAL domain-containing protein [Acetobacteraceae bacterium]|nr:EAL domain-containing protein [Acetobacteraceae bacterium]